MCVLPYTYRKYIGHVAQIDVVMWEMGSRSTQPLVAQFGPETNSNTNTRQNTLLPPAAPCAPVLPLSQREKPY